MGSGVDDPIFTSHDSAPSSNAKLSGQKNGYRRQWVAGSEHVAKVLKREETVPQAARAAVEDRKLRVSFQS
jgi:hypothetical protein